MLRALFFTTRKHSHHLVQHGFTQRETAGVFRIPATRQMVKFCVLIDLQIIGGIFLAIFQQPAIQKEGGRIYLLGYLIIPINGFLVCALR